MNGNMPPVDGRVRRLKALMRRLHRRCGAAHPIRVRLAHMPPDLYGDCHLVSPRAGRPYFQVRLNLRHPQWLEETMVHEWAHALAWYSGVQDHGPEWGVAFARCYCAANRTR